MEGGEKKGMKDGIKDTTLSLLNPKKIDQL
jgi:hypothetical protein